METLKIVNTGYEFVFKEYIFGELNKCHYSHLLLEIFFLEPEVEIVYIQSKMSKIKGEMGDYKAATQLLIFRKC